MPALQPIPCDHPGRARFCRGACRSCYDGWREALRPELRKRRLALLKIKNAAWHIKNRERVLRENREKYKGKDIAVTRGESLRRRYGLTLDDYEVMLEKQGGVCAICARPPRGKSKGKRLYVDHDKFSRLVRGLLCAGCNTAIGQFNHDPAMLRLAASYVAKKR